MLSADVFLASSCGDSVSALRYVDAFSLFVLLFVAECMGRSAFPISRAAAAGFPLQDTCTYSAIQAGLDIDGVFRERLPNHDGGFGLLVPIDAARVDLVVQRIRVSHGDVPTD